MQCRAVFALVSENLFFLRHVPASRRGASLFSVIGGGGGGGGFFSANCHHRSNYVCEYVLHGSGVHISARIRPKRGGTKGGLSTKPSGF